MITDWDEWTDILTTFARHIAPGMGEEEIETLVEEYIEANSEHLIGHYLPEGE